MNKTFTYSILQYKHSLLLREAVNVGIIFYFPGEDKFQFVSGNHQRVRAIYPDFDHTIYNRIIKRIRQRLVAKFDIFDRENNKSKSFQDYLHSNVLSEDATVLQFTDPVVSVDSFNNVEITVQKFSELLLPGIVTDFPLEDRHNEQFILKSYLNYILKRDGQAENKISKNRKINYGGISLNFDYSWKIRRNARVKIKSTNLVKPLSFDLKKAEEIQKKSVEFFGYLELLSPYADRNKIRFDLLVARPNDQNLWGNYEDGLKRLKKAKSYKRIITENELSDYSEETVKNLIQLD